MKDLRDKIIQAAWDAEIYTMSRTGNPVAAFVLDYDMRYSLVIGRSEIPGADPFQPGLLGPDSLYDIPIIYAKREWKCPGNLVDLRHLEDGG